MNKQKAQTSSTRILLVEDNEDDRMQVEDILLHSSESYQVDSFDRCADALEFFRKNDANCIILDYQLGAENGITMLAKLKQLDPHVPVIMLTGQGNEDLASASIKSGASDYIVKSGLSEIVLGTAIQNAIKQGRLERKIAMQASEQKVFLAVLVHDLKAPLRTMESLSKLALEEAESGDVDEMKACLGMQSDVATRAYDLVCTLENYALLDGEIDFTPVCLTSIAQAARENLGKIISDKNATITIGELPTILGHAPQLTQLLQNLFQNAMKYNNSENIEVSVDSADTESQSVSIAIRDNGIGISEDHITTIFTPFMRLWGKKQYEGVGLGLATCGKIVQRHNGQIWCNSIEGEGSQFHLSFPVHQLNS